MARVRPADGNDRFARDLAEAIKQVTRAAQLPGAVPDRVLLERIEQLARLRALLGRPAPGPMRGRLAILALAALAVLGGAAAVFLGPATTELALNARVRGVAFVTGGGPADPVAVSDRLTADRVVLHEVASVKSDLRLRPALRIDIVRREPAPPAGGGQPHITVAPVVVPAATRVEIRIVDRNVTRFDFAEPVTVRLAIRWADIEVTSPSGPQTERARQRAQARVAGVEAEVRRIDVTTAAGDLLLADSVPIRRLDLTRWKRTGAPESPSRLVASEMIGGELVLPEAGGRRYELLRGDHVVTRTAGGSLHDVRVRDGALALQFRGVVSGLQYGISTMDRMPRYFDVLSNQHPLAVWWTAGTYILVTGFGAVRWWGGRE
jgi:hypothetical protein